jgi:serine protease inhibitor ecotin
MKEYLPYLVSILTAVLSAIVSITVCKKQTKTEIDKIKEQSKANIELEREKLQLEKEKIELEHKLELEKIHTQNDDAFASGITDKLLDMAFQNPDVQKQFADGIKKGLKKK